jgi:hypothetical protein
MCSTTVFHRWLYNGRSGVSFYEIWYTMKLHVTEQGIIEWLVSNELEGIQKRRVVSDLRIIRH